jgi:hypothetical protein
VPKTFRAKLGLQDEDQLEVTVAHLDFINVQSYRLTSGGEFRLPSAIARTIELQAEQSPDSNVLFVAKFADPVAAASQVLNASARLAADSTPEERMARLEKAPTFPESARTEVAIFKRNPDVVAEVLYRAAGLCSRCKSQAPFLRRTDRTPYLEVHHKIQLAEGGEDTVLNAEALCPNCHRMLYHGERIDA